MTNPITPSKANPQFPIHADRRTWLLTSAASTIGVALARAVLAHGDNVVLGTAEEDLELCPWKGTGKGVVNGRFRGTNGLGGRGAEPPSERMEEFDNFLREILDEEGCEERVRVVGLDGRCESLPSGSWRREGSHWAALASDKGTRREGRDGV